MNVPVLFIIFKRPRTTQLVFEKIREIKPKQLFIASDAYRKDKEGEKELCEETMKLVLDNIDWDCEVKTLFQTENLGCGLGPLTAINWFFDHVEQGIILEDDCLPDLSFFNYCELLLDRYKDNTNVMSISGDNFQNGIKRGEGSYYFSNIFHGWGWATWKRAWQLNDYTMSEWPNFPKDKLLEKCNDDSICYEYWNRILESVYQKTINADPWDYQFLFSIWLNDGVNIHPNVNLISNIGFGEDATHTSDSQHKLANLPTEKYIVDKAPKKIKITKSADEYTFYNVYVSSIYQVKKSLLKRVLNKINITILKK